MNGKINRFLFHMAVLNICLLFLTQDDPELWFSEVNKLADMVGLDPLGEEGKTDGIQ